MLFSRPRETDTYVAIKARLPATDDQLVNRREIKLGLRPDGISNKVVARARWARCHVRDAARCNVERRALAPSSVARMRGKRKLVDGPAVNGDS